MLATDVMRSSFATIKPTANVLDAVQLLLETDQRGLPVINDDGDLVGMISEGDFLHRDELGVNPDNGLGNVLSAIATLPDDQRAPIEAAMPIQMVLTGARKCWIVS